MTRSEIRSSEAIWRERQVDFTTSYHKVRKPYFRRKKPWWKIW